MVSLKACGALNLGSIPGSRPKMKGFKDYYPKEKRIQNYIFQAWKKIAERYGYFEVDGPILEPIEIYSKSGQEIPEQMYILTDKSGRKLALRPEFTPTLARMINENSSLPKPIKWYSISKCFRYEQPQSGRQREFSQFNIDFLGSTSMKADAEIILTAIKIMKEFKLTKKDFFIRISNKKLMQDLLKSINIEEKYFKEIQRILDKICKYKKEDIISELKTKGLAPKQISELFKILSIKSLSQIKISSKGLDELKELFSYLKEFNVLEYCKLDLSIMRGFDYYTSTVFEVFDSSMQFRAIAGGGRYDELAKNCPGVGYGMGDAVLELFLISKKKLPELNQNLVFIIPINTFKQSLKITEKLRDNGINASMDLLDRSISKNLNYANQENIPFVLIIGKEELKKKKLKLKNMKTGKEKLLDLKSLIKFLRTI